MAKKFLEPYKLVDATSMAADITSAPVILKHGDNVALHFKWTGTPVGTFSVEVAVQDPTSPTLADRPLDADWDALTFSPVLTAPAGAAGQFYLDLNQLSATAYRIKYTRTSGTGALTVWTGYKGIGG